MSIFGLLHHSICAIEFSREVFRVRFHRIVKVVRIFMKMRLHFEGFRFSRCRRRQGKGQGSKNLGDFDHGDYVSSVLVDFGATASCLFQVTSVIATTSHLFQVISVMAIASYLFQVISIMVTASHHFPQFQVILVMTTTSHLFQVILVIVTVSHSFLQFGDLGHCNRVHFFLQFGDFGLSNRVPSILGDFGHGERIPSILGDFSHGNHVSIFSSILGDLNHCDRVSSLLWFQEILIITTTSRHFPQFGDFDHYDCVTSFSLYIGDFSLYTPCPHSFIFHPTSHFVAYVFLTSSSCYFGVFPLPLCMLQPFELIACVLIILLVPLHPMSLYRVHVVFLLYVFIPVLLGGSATTRS